LCVPRLNIVDVSQYVWTWQVRWRPVLWGLGLQFVLGVLILRWEPGYYFFRYLGEKVRVFLEFADEGSKFVFGPTGLEDHPMAFKVDHLSLWRTWLECLLTILRTPSRPFAAVNKKAVLSQIWPRRVPYTWVPWKFSGLPDYAHGYYSRHFSWASTLAKSSVRAVYE